MDTKGYYQKYRVERMDGKPVKGPTFTLEIDHDPHALVALKAYIGSLSAANRDGKWADLITDLSHMVWERE